MLTTSGGSPALAYLLYFRLIAQVGPANAITVSLLIPAFAAVWGAIFLGDVLSASTLIGCAVMLFGTALAADMLKP